MIWKNALPLCVLLICVLLVGCEAAPKNDPLAYQVYPITMAVRMHTPSGDCDATLTIEAAGCGTMTLLTAEGGEGYALTLRDGNVTVTYGDQTFCVRPDPLLVPPLCEIVSLFSLPAGDAGIQGEQRVLPDGATLTVCDGVPQSLIGAGYEITITSYCAGNAAVNSKT